MKTEKLNEKKRLEELKSEQFTQSTLNKKSQQHFINKFTKEVIRQWQACPVELLDEDNRNNETMNGTVLKHLLTELGFIEPTSHIRAKRSKTPTSRQLSNRLASDLFRKVEEPTVVSVFNVNALHQLEKQDKKVAQLWKVLGGEHYGHITLNNLRMFLLAIKGLHVMPDVKFTDNMS